MDRYWHETLIRKDISRAGRLLNERKRGLERKDVMEKMDEMRRELGMKPWRAHPCRAAL